MKIPTARTAALALHIVAEAQELLARADMEIPRQLVPQLLRQLADRVEKQTPPPGAQTSGGAFDNDLTT